MRIGRFRAFSFHLIGSAFIGLCCAALVFLLWYPWPLPVATGVTGIFLLLLSVDITIGPLITLIIFNPAKKELKRDLAIILLLQIGALLYGMHAVWVARPVYTVFCMDRFDLVFANDLTKEKLDKVSDTNFQSIPWGRPQLAAAQNPDDPEERNDVIFNSTFGGDDLPQLPQYYVPYSTQKALVLEKLQPLDNLKSFNSGNEAAVDQLIGKYATNKVDVGFLPLRGKVQDLTVIVHKDSADVLEIVDLNPWP